MPTIGLDQQDKKIYQRDQYDRGGFDRWYWDRRNQDAPDLSRPSDRTILDIAYGESITREKMHRLFLDRHATGVDISHENIEYAGSVMQKCIHKGFLAKYPVLFLAGLIALYYSG